MTAHSDTIRATFAIKGTVQGVGFRPALYRLASQAGLGGSVQNRSGTVRLVLEGSRGQIRIFAASLASNLPPNAAILQMNCEGEEPLPGTPAPFAILESDGSEETEIAIPPDLAMCPDCAREIATPTDRRYGYAFTTCTNCGPRYTVVNDMPYDRERTTMAAFPLCPDCRLEYEEPANRRFHAESTACPACGPRLRFEDARGRKHAGDPLRSARQALAGGGVVAVRGLGGFLLACDALNREALLTLRARKTRPDKPFAVMAPNLDTVRTFCHLPRAAEDLLLSAQAPIVILDVRIEELAARGLPLDLITPDTDTLGVMLPTTPLHHLLLTPLGGDPTPPFGLLVMTSGNKGGEPICISNDEARQRLSGIADHILTHDREINLRNDDSLCAIQLGRPQVWRRARGYAPAPLRVQRPFRECVLAMGAELKNAIALGYDHSIVLSPHIGDLETPEAVHGLGTVVSALPRFLCRDPERIAVDLHPDMHSTRLGRRVARELDIPLVRVQHHHAHAAACLAEHGCEEGIALVFDGTGYGPDGTIWGAELLHVEYDTIRRLGTFAAVPLAGGDAAVRHPVRQLLARWFAAGAEVPAHWLDRLAVTAESAHVWQRQCELELNAPLTHAAGRLFDAFSAALGIAPGTITYEGQAAIRLEAAARRAGAGDTPEIPYRTTEDDGHYIVDWSPAFLELLANPPQSDDGPVFAMAAHRAIAAAAVDMVRYALDCTRTRTVALSGGVFMNRILTRLVRDSLAKLGVEPLLHRVTPPNDGAIAFGQAVLAGYATANSE